MPVIQRPPEKYSTAANMKMLLSSNIDEKRITYKLLIHVQYSGTFVIDLTKLANPDDIMSMHMDIRYKMAHTLMYLSVSMMKILGPAPGASGSNVYYLWHIHV